MEHWLPLFEDKMATLFDHLRDEDIVIRDSGAVAASATSRMDAIADYYENRKRADAAHRPAASAR